MKSRTSSLRRIKQEEAGLAKKGRSWDRIRKLLLLVGAGGIIVLVFYFRMKLAQSSFEIYERTEVCQTRPDCRQILEAMVIESRTESYSRMEVRGKSASPVGTVSRYFVRVDPVSKDAVRLQIIPTALLHSTHLVDDSILLGNLVSTKYNNFAEEVFPVGATIKVEIWNGKVTLLFPAYVGFEKTAENTFTYAISAKKWPASDDEIFIPTYEHPLARYEVAKQDFINSIYVVAASIFLFWWLFIGYSSTRSKPRTKK